MAVYKIFPEKSATLYSYYPTLNTGLDEILELSTFESIDSTNEVSRPIIKFSQDDLDNVFNNIVTNTSTTYLKLSLAYATELPLDYTVYCHALAADWNVGTGRLANSPITTDGVSWQYTDQLGGSAWFIPGSFPTDTTGSYQSGSNVGGGLWWTNYGNNISLQSFTKNSSKDIKINVTDITDAWVNGDIDNYGFILKHSDLIEFTSASKFETKYFSGNTHTIYPPCLEIRWDDSSYNTTLTEITSPNIVVTLGNNQGEYKEDAIQRFRVNVRDRFPARAFQSTSVYLNNKVLPEEGTYWALKDLDTNETIINFDENYTKISADSEGNYFDVYMNGLEPERYYKLLIKTTISGSTLVLDDNYYFKITQNPDTDPLIVG